jgi:hypothetical protein
MPTLDLDFEFEFAKTKLPLNLYKLTQDLYAGYDTYDSCIVAAASEDFAKQMHPSGYPLATEVCQYADWPSASEVDSIQAKLIGYALPGATSCVISSSFNVVHS